jgi:hypothetical protein
MKFDSWWKKIWTIHGVARQAGQLVTKNSTFWIEPVTVNGTVVYYTLHPENGMHDCLKGLTLYPLGCETLPYDPLPAWKEDDGTAETFRCEASRIRMEGMVNPLAQRLEGTFEFKGPHGVENLVLRIYCFPGAEAGGKDWVVFDVIAEITLREDGTAHADD